MLPKGNHEKVRGGSRTWIVRQEGGREWKKEPIAYPEDRDGRKEKVEGKKGARHLRKEGGKKRLKERGKSSLHSMPTGI